MNTVMETSELIAQEKTILQEKECASIDDASLPAAQVLTEQIKYAGSEDTSALLFVP